MRYLVVDDTEFIYPDTDVYATGSQVLDLFSPRGSYAAAQVLFWDLPEDGRIDIRLSLSGFESEIYGLLPIPVETNAGMSDEAMRPNNPSRRAPFEVCDCLRPYDGTIPTKLGRGGIYLAIPVSEDAVPGTVTGELLAGKTKIPLRLEIFSARVPRTTLKIIQGYDRRPLANFHGLTPGTSEYAEMDRKYLAALRRMHQNMMFTSGVKVTKTGENSFSFDFSALESNIRTYLDAGMEYFTAPCIGGRHSWSESTIYLNGNIPAMSYEGYCYLSQYLPRLTEMLRRNGWLERFCMEICDEPNNANATEFRALCGLVHRLAPEIRLMDAMSYGPLHGSLDIWVPLNAEYQKHRAELESFRTNGAEIWHYVCCVPRGEGFINRFMDCPLIESRYLFWGNYRYSLTGYLHWATNCYQPGQNPFLQSCPEHHNADSVCFLPAGDTHLLYPGTDGPWLSIRAESMRSGVEEYELLRLLSESDRDCADRLCSACFRSFNDVEYDPNAFRRIKKELLKAVSALF